LNYEVVGTISLTLVEGLSKLPTFKVRTVTRSTRAI